MHRKTLAAEQEGSGAGKARGVPGGAATPGDTVLVAACRYVCLNPQCTQPGGTLCQLWTLWNVGSVATALGGAATGGRACGARSAWHPPPLPLRSAVNLKLL